MDDLNPKQIKQIQRIEKLLKQGNFAIAEYLMEIEDKIDAEIPSIKDIMERVKGEPGKDYVITEKDKSEIRDFAIKAVLQGINLNDLKGNPGKDYVLTEKDKKEIAGKITVPVVNKIIEKTETIIEQPIEIVREVRMSLDTGDQIIGKINDVKDKGPQIDAKHIKNLPQSVTRIVERGGFTVGGHETPIKNGITGRPFPKDASGAWIINPESSTTPNLQQVTDVGSNTTNSITADAGFITGGFAIGGSYVGGDTYAGGIDSSTGNAYLFSLRLNDISNNTWGNINHDNGIYGFTDGSSNPAYLSAGGYVVSGGSSSQFLKGDGSLDSNSYLTDISGLDHNTLGNLTVGDVHTQYAYLAGRSGGQTLIGGTGNDDNLILKSTTASGDPGGGIYLIGSDAGDVELARFLNNQTASFFNGIFNLSLNGSLFAYNTGLGGDIDIGNNGGEIYFNDANPSFSYIQTQGSISAINMYSDSLETYLVTHYDDYWYLASDGSAGFANGVFYVQADGVTYINSVLLADPTRTISGIGSDILNQTLNIGTDGITIDQYHRLYSDGSVSLNNTALQIDTAGIATFGNKVINGNTMRLKGYTVAGLPAGTVGDTAYVTDALAPAFLTVVVGGGAIKTTVFYNGANWVAQ